MQYKKEDDEKEEITHALVLRDNFFYSFILIRYKFYIFYELDFFWVANNHLSRKGRRKKKKKKHFRHLHRKNWPAGGKYRKHRLN